jgi:CheY-like chemotaxis protein
MSATLDSGQPVSPTSKQAARILVVDDEQGVGRVVTRALTRAGYAVEQVANASQAIATLQSESFDLVLSDVMMPGMNGHELAQWVATNHHKTQTALMTGYDATSQGYPFFAALQYAGQAISAQGSRLIRRPRVVEETTHRVSLNSKPPAPMCIPI